MTDKTKMKPLKDLTLMDRFLFAEAMEDPVISKNVLEIILGKDMQLLNPTQVEKEVTVSGKSMSISKKSSPVKRLE